MKRVQITLIAYSVLVAIGGLIGHLIAGSLASIIASFTFAGIILFGLGLMPYYPRTGKYINYVTLLTLSCFFIYRWVLTAKFMPAGMMTIITVVTFAYVLHLLERKHRLRQH